MEGSFFSLLPTLVAVVAAIITKQVYIALAAGILTGALMIAGGNPIEAIRELLLIVGDKISPSSDGLSNAGVLIFIVELGIIVALMSASGGTAAFSNLLSRRIKTSRGASLTAMGLSCMMFADDCFNRMAVGTTMLTASDRCGVPRTDLARIICGMSVSICILVPISSWGSAITGNISDGLGGGLGGGSAFAVYVKSLPYCFYPILTVLSLALCCVCGKRSAPNVERAPITTEKGRPMYLILPVATLTATDILLMTTAGYDNETTLAISGAVTILACLVMYVPTKAMSLKGFASCFGDGIRSVSDIILILVLAWTLTGVTEKLGVNAFISSLTSKMGETKKLLPAIMFLVAMGTSFATGTAWGTFGILIPLAVPMFSSANFVALTVAAVLSGSVFGNHVSPISDSTILSSGICNCDHMELVRAQLPSAMIIAAISLVGYVIAGLVGGIWGIVTCLSLFLLFSALYVWRKSHPNCQRKVS